MKLLLIVFFLFTFLVKKIFVCFFNCMSICPKALINRFFFILHNTEKISTAAFPYFFKAESRFKDGFAVFAVNELKFLKFKSQLLLPVL